MSRQNSIVQILGQKLKSIPIKELARQTGVDRNAIRRVLRGERVHAKTRAKLLKVAANWRTI
jgi:transcriptional regulator with XRE-family HTH domain